MCCITTIILKKIEKLFYFRINVKQTQYVYFKVSKYQNGQTRLHLHSSHFNPRTKRSDSERVWKPRNRSC
jgi:hypothetical protein